MQEEIGYMITHTHTGPYALGTQTTRSGTKFREWLHTTGLQLGDSFIKMKARGTWHGAHVKEQWHEIDYLLTNVGKNAECRTSPFGGISNHTVKAYLTQLPSSKMAIVK